MCKKLKNKYVMIATLLLCMLTLTFVAISCSAKNPMNPNDKIVIPQFNEEIHSPNMFTVMFHHEIGNIELGIVPTKTEEGHVQIGIESFDKIAREFDFIEMFQNRLFFCQYAIEDAVWEGYFPNNTFTVTTKDGSAFQDAVKALLHDDSVQQVYYVFSDDPFYWGHARPPVIPNHLLICFDYNTLGIFEWGFEVSKNEDGQVQTGIASFDSISVKYNFTDMMQFHFDPYEPILIHKQNLVRNVFLISMENDEILLDARNALLQDVNILAAVRDYNGCHMFGEFYPGGE
ncbi:MAG: hypothetical protein FWG98_13700 [Candidatus Cloacimonetes bacterium]|nr:hypothetical protein [Candidatus Cloacimonadota bacterium]